MADNDLFTDEQIKLLRKIETVRKLRGTAGYREAIDVLLSGLLEKEGLTIDDLEQFQIKQKSFAELLAACELKDISPKFTETGWPLEPIELNENEWVLGECTFKSRLTVEYGLRLLGELSTKGQMRCPTGSRRAMQWIAEHPDKQLNYPIILPVLQYNSTEKTIPIFTSLRETNGETKRRLTMGGLETIVLPSCRWLVLRKRNT